jgi:hypothetical protein
VASTINTLWTKCLVRPTESASAGKMGIISMARHFIFKSHCLCRIVSSGMLCRVALVRTDVLEELSDSFIRVTRIGELGTTLAVTSNQVLVISSQHASVASYSECCS